MPTYTSVGKYARSLSFLDLKTARKNTAKYCAFCSITDRRRVSRREQYEPAARGTFSASSDKYVLVVCSIRQRPSLPKSARKNTPCGAKQFCRELILGEDKAKTQFIQTYERGFQRKITQNQPRKIRFLLFSSAYAPSQNACLSCVFHVKL